MKRFIVLLIAFLSVALIHAQTVTLPAMPVGYTYQSTATAYTLSGTTARNFIFSAPQHYPTTQDYVIKLDSVAGGDQNVVVLLAGQKSALKGDWTTIATATWYGTTKDTVIILSNTTANRYRSYRSTVTAAGAGTRKILNQELKLFLR
jgi:hypothetical protein